MKNFGFDVVFGNDDATPEALPRFDGAVTEDAENAHPHPLEVFFTDALLESQLGGADELAAFKSSSANVDEKFSEGYRKIAHDAEHKTTAPIAPIPEIRRCVKKHRTFFPSGGVVIAELDAAGAVIRSYEEN
jgi:hypothetical protein